ncbi:MAG: FAD-dependent oxidoreductase [Amphritea sp.]|nr:FAD-dependent oxidoreductase [Amphritea sp.]MBQ0785561.1 FAD-dependent oxidoreductase [Amphritea sp.]
MSGVVIIGGGHAGYQSADSLRRAGYEGVITLVDGEGHLPYQRPPLSKSHLLNDTGEDALLFRTQTYYDDHNIDLKLGHRVVSISRTEKQVRLDNNETLCYEKLIIATGAKLRQLDLPGSKLNGVGYIKSLDDIRYIQDHLNQTEETVIIGGGFIALEFAATAAKLGKKVTVLVRGQRILANNVTAELSQYMLDIHHQHGVDIRFDAQVDHISGDDSGNVEAVRLKDGTLLPAQLVLAGIGVTADTELAVEAKLLCHDGVIVDAQCRTNDRDIFAAGDSAKYKNPFTGTEIRLESVQNAVDQAKVIALVITGQEAKYHSVPWFWSDQYDIKLQMVGIHDGYTHFYQRGSQEEDKFSLFFFRDEKLIAIHTVNRPADHMAGRKLIFAGMSPTQEQIEDAGFKLTSLLKR